MQPEIFQGRGYFIQVGHFYKHFVKNTQKECCKREHFFLLETTTETTV